MIIAPVVIDDDWPQAQADWTRGPPFIDPCL